MLESCLVRKSEEFGLEHRATYQFAGSRPLQSLQAICTENHRQANRVQEDYRQHRQSPNLGLHQSSRLFRVTSRMLNTQLGRHQSWQLLSG